MGKDFKAGENLEWQEHPIGLFFSPNDLYLAWHVGRYSETQLQVGE